jgi:signal transduction histidine kinase
LNQYPLTFAGQPIGTLLVADRSPNDPLTPADHQLLVDLSHQIGAAAHAMLLTTNLEQARLRLVTERGEARRRLGSDLHDVVGHQLVGLNRQLQHAMHELGQNPAQARQQLAEIDNQLTALTNQVRQLAHQLYPPELVLLGLVGALREQVETHPTLQITLDAPERFPKLSAEVETAVYAITLEAITNIEKHAHAQTCAIQLRLNAASQPPQLELEIVDDGTGVAAGANAGLGLLSMQARAAEVGGVCKIMQNVGGGGTAVSVRIPCPNQPE